MMLNFKAKAKLQIISKFGLFFEIQKYEAKMNSNARQ